MNLFYKFLFMFAWIIVLSGCSNRSVSSGRATITGKLTDSLLGENSKSYSIITFKIPNVILGGTSEYQTSVEQDGSFSIDIPIISPVYAEVGADLEKYYNRILISQGKTISLDLFIDDTSRLCLNEKEWKNIYSSKVYGFNGIPSYLLFDSSGIFKNKISGYPGNAKMREMIEKLL